MVSHFLSRVSNTPAHNLSKTCSFSTLDIKILGLGLKFIPRVFIPRNHLLNNIISPFNKLERALQLQLYFKDNNSKFSHPIIPPIHTNAWTPSLQHGEMVTIKSLIELLKQKFRDAILPRRCHNSIIDSYIISRLSLILKNPLIVVKPSDKNLGLTILDRDTYLNLCYNHLDDEETYRQIGSEFNLNTIFYSLEQLLLSYNGKLSKDFLYKISKSLLQLKNSKEVRVAPFYIIPKVHKKTLSGRPIVSAPSTPTYFASKYLSNLLLPVVHLYPYICKSNDQVIQFAKNNNFPSSTVIGVADVVSLYPSIPIHEGVKKVKRILERHAEQFIWDQNMLDFICDLLLWVLTNNYCEFDDTFYLQIKGTAMGTPVAPVFANLYLIYHDEKAFARVNPIIYFRYIDDLFVLFTNNTDPDMFFQAYQDDNIKLDAISYGKEGVFLDLSFFLSEPVNDNRVLLYYKLYQKPNNLFQYLPSLSNHKPSIFINIIRNEIKRYMKNCSRLEDYNEAKDAFLTRLLVRGYTPSIIQLGLLQIGSLPTPYNNPTQVSRHSQVSNPTYKYSKTIFLNLVLPLPLNIHPRIPWSKILQIPEEYIKEVPFLKYIFIRVVSLNSPNIGKRILRSYFKSLKCGRPNENPKIRKP